MLKLGLFLFLHTNGRDIKKKRKKNKVLKLGLFLFLLWALDICSFLALGVRYSGMNNMWVEGEIPTGVRYRYRNSYWDFYEPPNETMG